MDVKPSDSQVDEDTVTEIEARNAIRALLRYVGENPDREGLIDTPKRVVKAWDELTIGYSIDPREILTTSFDGGNYDQMVVLRNIEFRSMCEHHMLPFSGVAHVAYIPKGRVVGISKMARLVDCYSRRLQIQEQMTQQIANAMMKHLRASGAGVKVIAHHSCMSCRGVMKHQSELVTTCLLGAFKKHAVKEEFLMHCVGG